MSALSPPLLSLLTNPTIMQTIHHNPLQIPAHRSLTIKLGSPMTPYEWADGILATMPTFCPPWSPETCGVAEAWTRTLEGGVLALAVFNRVGKSRIVSFGVNELDGVIFVPDCQYEAMDGTEEEEIWVDLGSGEEARFAPFVEEHDTRIFIVRPQKRGYDEGGKCQIRVERGKKWEGVTFEQVLAALLLILLGRKLTKNRNK